MALTSIDRDRERARERGTIHQGCGPRVWITEACNLVRGTSWEMRSLVELTRLAEQMGDRVFARNIYEYQMERRASKEYEWRLRGQTRSKRLTRKSRDQAMRDLGLVKVRGALGGTYWE